MEVEVFGNESSIVVHKVEKINEKEIDKGINIKIENTNNAQTS